MQIQSTVNKNRRPGPVNTTWRDKVGIHKPRLRTDKNLLPGSVNTNWGPGPVNINWGPGPGSGAKQRAGGMEIQIPN